MKRKAERLKRLIHLAQFEEKKAILDMSEAIGNWKRAKELPQTLQGYVQQYYKQSPQTGSTVAGIIVSNYYNFMQQLNDATAVAKRDEGRAHQAYRLSLGKYHGCRKHKRTYELLLDRHQEEITIKQRRQDQMALDYFPAQHRRKK